MPRQARSRMKDYSDSEPKTPAKKSLVKSPALAPAKPPKLGKSFKSATGSMSGSKRMSRKY